LDSRCRVATTVVIIAAPSKTEGEAEADDREYHEYQCIFHAAEIPG
jgi:hypothetical protein